MSEAYTLHHYVLHRRGLRPGKMNNMLKLRNFNQRGFKVHSWRRVVVEKMVLLIKEPLTGRIQLFKDVLDKEARPFTHHGRILIPLSPNLLPTFRKPDRVCLAVDSSHFPLKIAPIGFLKNMDFRVFWLFPLLA